MMNVKDVAKTIFSQFGGGKAMMMIGGSCTYGEDFKKIDESYELEKSPFLVVRFKTKAAKIAGKSPNLVYIAYNYALDLYSIRYARIHGTNFNLLGEGHDNVYAEDLKTLFEDDTKLYLSF